MKVKVRRRLKKKVKISLIAILIFTFLFLGGFNTIKSAYVGVRDYFGAGDVPVHSKNIKDNEDGTYTLSLDVVGESELSTHMTGRANILIIYDTSSSMTRSRANGGNTGPRRADAAEKVIYDFAQELFSKQDSSDPTNIEMALVTFNSNGNGRTKTEVDWTSDKTKFGPTLLSSTGSYNSARLSYDSGTNWEAALT